MKMPIAFVLLLGVVALCGQDKQAAAPAAQKPAEPAAVAPKADFPIIGYIEKQGRTITIKAGPKGTLYSVKTSDGKVLYENLSSEQLRAQAPELHDFLKTSVAGPGAAKDASGRPMKIDASLGLR